MTPLKHETVVVPVDFSDETESAIRAGLERVENPSGLHVLHVVFPLDVRTHGVLPEEASDRSREEAARLHLEGLLKQFGAAGAHAAVLSGDAGLETADYAKRMKADLIVLPSHGYHGVKRLLIGSTAERIIRHAHCSVLVLRRMDAELRRRRTAGVSRRARCFRCHLPPSKFDPAMIPLKHRAVVVPVDFAADSVDAIRAAHQRVLDPDDLHVVHVLVPHDFSTPAVLHKFAAGENREDETRRQIELLIESAGAAGAHAVVLVGDPGLQATDYAKRMNAELIVVMSHGRHGVRRLLLGSTAERIVRHAHCSVLVLRHAE